MGDGEREGVSWDRVTNRDMDTSKMTDGDNMVWEEISRIPFIEAPYVGGFMEAINGGVVRTKVNGKIGRKCDILKLIRHCVEWKKIDNGKWEPKLGDIISKHG